MNKYILIYLILFIAGCELHQQSASSSGGASSSKFQLGVLEKMFANILADDYFALEEAVAEGVDLNVLNKQGQGLLVEAVKLERDLITQLFIKNGADPQLSDKADQTAFDVAEIHENPEVWISILEDNGIPKDYMNQKVVELVSTAAEDTQQDIIKKLTLYFSKGADVNARNPRKYTLLILASTKNLPEIVTFLCQTDGSDVNARADRWTALSLTKRLMRRKPELLRIVNILKSCQK